MEEKNRKIIIIQKLIIIKLKNIQNLENNLLMKILDRIKFIWMQLENKMNKDIN